MQCKAKSKRSGEQCKKSAVEGYEVCEIHGGKTPRGIASPHFKHGRYSKDIPARLAERYLEAISDPDLLSLDAEIAATTTRIGDLFHRADFGESGIWFRKLNDTLDKLNEAAAVGDDYNRNKMQAQLTALIRKGGDIDDAWQELAQLFDLRRRLASDERKRRVDMQQMITTEQMMALLGAIVGILKQYVEDQNVLFAIAAELRRLVSRNVGGEPDGDGA